MKKTSKFLFDEDDVGVRRDFAWRQRKINPYLQNQSSADWRMWAKITLLTIGVMGMIMVCVYHPFFHIKNIKLTGLQRIDAKEFTGVVMGAIDYRHFLIYPGKSYFLVDVSEVMDMIKERFPVSAVVVKKIFPDTLDIQIEEKISTVIYDDGKTYSYLDTGGKIVEILRKVGENELEDIMEIVTSTDELGQEISENKVVGKIHKPDIEQIIKEIGDYPLVYDLYPCASEINQQALDQKIVAGIIDWFNLVNKQTNISFGYIVIDNDLGTGLIKTRNGWEMKVRLTGEIDRQFLELQYILKEKIQNQKFNYIDLRFPGKVYWQ